MNRVQVSCNILQLVTLHCEKSPFNWLTVHSLLYLLCFPCLMKIEQTHLAGKKVVSLSTLKILINTTQKYSYYTPKCIKIYICKIYILLRNTLL